MKIAFSITTHESPYTLESQINQIFKFVEDPYIFVHINLKYKDSFLKQAHDNDLKFIKNNRVFINENCIISDHDCGMLVYAHLNNFVLLRSTDINFDYVVIDSHTSMFVKKGIESYIKNYNCSSVDGIMPQELIVYLHNDKILNICKEKQWGIIKKQTEGSFYQLKHIDAIINFMKEYEQYNGVWGNYAREEIIFPTVVNNLFENLRTTSTITRYYFCEKVNEDKIQEVLNNPQYFSIKSIPIESNQIRQIVENL